jgi:ketosteroid isomerase-like protein
MPGEIDRAIVERFYEACAARDLDQLMAFFAPDVTWVYRGPPTVLPYCGEYHGRDAVRGRYEKMFRFNRLCKLEIDSLVVERDRSAALIKSWTELHPGQRKVVNRFSHFLRWQNGQIVEFRAMLDSLDVVEQVLNQELVPVLEDA